MITENAGVNDNGVQWIKTDKDEYYCFYYIAEGVELSKEYEGVTMNYINKLNFEDLD